MTYNVIRALALPITLHRQTKYLDKKCAWFRTNYSTLRSRISLERIKQSTSAKRHYQLRPLPRSTKLVNFGPLTKNFTQLMLTQPKWTLRMLCSYWQQLQARNYIFSERSQLPHATFKLCESAKSIFQSKTVLPKTDEIFFWTRCHARSQGVRRTPWDCVRPPPLEFHSTCLPTRPTISWLWRTRTEILLSHA